MRQSNPFGGHGCAHALVAVTLAAAFCIALFRVNDFDIWFHLKAGEYIVHAKGIPWEDPFSYTATHPWVYHSWLSGVAFHLLYALGGWPALLSYKAAVIALMVWILLRTARREGTLTALACVLLVFMLYAVRFRLDLRPHVHTTLFLALFVCVLERHRREGEGPLWALPVGMALWSNAHPGWVAGIAIVGIYFVSQIPDFRFQRGMSASGKRLLITLAGCVATAFVNPYGAHAVFLPFQHVQSDYYKLLTLEWRRMPFNPEFLSPLSHHFLYGSSLYWIMLALVGVSVAATWRALTLTSALTLLVFGYLSVSTRRHADLFGVVAFPIWCRHTALALDKAKAWRWAALRPAAVNLGLALAIAALVGVKSSRRWGEYVMGFGFTKSGLPVKAAEFIEKSRLTGRMFNQWTWGPYLIWRCYPERRVFIDTRNLVYDESLFREHSKVVNAAPGWDEALQKHDVNFIVADHQWPDRFYASENWKIVFWDTEGLVAVRNTAESAGFIREHLCEASAPGRITRGIGDAVKRRQIMVELLAKLREDPDCQVAHYNLGRCWVYEQEYEKGLVEFRRTLELSPRYSLARHNAGFCLYRMRRLDEAIREYEMALALNPKLLASHKALGDCWRDKGELGRALTCYRRAVKLNARFWEARYQIVSVFLRMGRKDEAADELETLVRLGDTNAEVRRKLGELRSEQRLPR